MARTKSLILAVSILSTSMPVGFRLICRCNAVHFIVDFVVIINCLAVQSAFFTEKTSFISFHTSFHQFRKELFSGVKETENETSKGNKALVETFQEEENTHTILQ